METQSYASNCECTKKQHTCRFIVLTGGPGAGKTAALELASRVFCKHVVVLPESASIIFGGGFWRRKSRSGQKAAQRAIFHVQKQLETIVDDEKIATIALCDRGTLDGLAYWPDSEASFLKELELDRVKELEHYSTVIHMRTPGPTGGAYERSHMRIETQTEASELDSKIENAWQGHPNRIFIESTEHFVNKAQITLDLIAAELPDCCKRPWLHLKQNR